VDIRGIYLENFCSYLQENVPLTAVTCAALVGENGAGKSTLIDAITWPLFGVGSKGGKGESGNYVTRGKQACKVGLTFAVGAQVYKVVRGYSIPHSKTTLDFTMATADGGWQACGGKDGSKSITETQAAIIAVLRMDYTTFVRSCLVLQGQSDALTRPDVTDAERKAVLASILGLEAWEGWREKAHAQVMALNAKRQAVEQEVLRLDTEAANGPRLLLDAQATKAALAELMKEVQSREEVVAALQAELAAEAGLQSQLAAANDDAKAKASATLQAQQKQQAALNTIEDAKRKVQEVKGVLARAKEVADAKESLGVFKVDLLDWDTRAQDDRRLNRLIADLQQSKAAFQHKRASSLAALDTEYRLASDQTSVLGKVPCSGDTKRTCPLLANAQRAIARMEAINKERDELRTKEWPDEARMQSAMEERDAVAYDEHAHQDARNALTDIQAVAALEPQIQAATERLAEQQQRITDAQEAHKAAQTEEGGLAVQQQGIKARIAQLKEQLDGMGQVRTRLLVAQGDVTSLKQREVEQRNKLATLQAGAEMAEKAAAKASKMRDDNADLLEQSKAYELLDQACSKKGGVPALIVENAVPQLERLANDMLATMAGGRLGVQLHTQQDTKAGTQQEVLRIVVMQDGVERPYITFSGAERFMVDLALRVGLSKFLSHRAGAEVKFFCLDEGIGCADAANREAITEAIMAVAHEFGKCLVVTHLEELKERFPQRIEVTKDANGSHVTVV
jgi:exonuclease SbcC